MFRGSIPQVVLQILSEVAHLWNANEVYVGTSGNFTIERALASTGQFTLHSNDVTLYSSIIGAYLSGQPFRCELKQVAGLEWLAEYMGTMPEQMATIMLSTQLQAGISATGEGKENEYYDRMREAFKKAFPELHAKTVARVQSVQLRLASYYSGDVIDWLDTIPLDKPVMCYPPFANVGAAAQYSRDTKKLNLLFDWDEPTYPMLDGERRIEFVKKLSERPYWAFGSNRKVEGLERYLRGMTKLTNRGTIIYTYHPAEPRRIVVPNQEIEGLMVERLKPGQEIGNQMALAPLSYKQFQAVRSQYMNIGIRPGSATLPVAVLVDGYLVGVYAFSSSPHPGSYAEPSSIYLLSDFPVAPTDYPRLSKLVLYAAVSKESQLLAERITKRRIRSLYTTAYSNNPVSMKYRGIYKIYNRKPNPTANMAWGDTIDCSSNEYYNRKYELNYTGRMGQWDLAEGLAIWKKKHGEKKANGNTDNQD